MVGRLSILRKFEGSPSKTKWRGLSILILRSDLLLVLCSDVFQMASHDEPPTVIINTNKMNLVFTALRFQWIWCLKCVDLFAGS
jgi:hypothetical protein